MGGYLDTILNRTHIIWYTKIRISNHMFAVETGMKDCVYFVKKQTNLVIEDEKHALLHCPRYESLTKELYNSINELCPNV